MDGLIISYLFFLAIPLYFLGIILRSAFPKFENDAISITLWILSVLICGFIGFWHGEDLITILGQYALFNGSLVSACAVHGWDNSYGVKTIISILVAREKKIFF